MGIHHVEVEQADRKAENMAPPGTARILIITADELAN
jgi:hypothetical protein